jgi:23S rRNA (pseudouridine1915-N3)-methyltransferase
MKVEFWMIGKTAFPYLQTGMDDYAKRLGHYNPFEQIVLPDVKNGGKMSSDALKLAEAELVMQKLQPTDALILLDERGKEYTSEALAVWTQARLMEPHRKLIFLIGGAYGFDEKIYQRANYQLSLSRLTFSHQMIRLFALEQLYRVFTILRGESYHNS